MLACHLTPHIQGLAAELERRSDAASLRIPVLLACGICALGLIRPSHVNIGITSGSMRLCAGSELSELVGACTQHARDMTNKCESFQSANN